MALSDFLFNTGNKIKMGLSRFAPKQNYVSPSGDYDPRQFNNYPTWYKGEKVQPRLTMSEMLLGQKAQTPAQEGQAVTDENGNTTLKMGTSEAPRTGGILPDIMSGFDENRNNAFSLNNLEQGTLEDGRKKGFAYKLGEGLGSIARIANTPLGRGLIVGGLVTATGGNPLQALAYGGGATMLNQQNVLKDQMYRKDLESQGVDTSGIRGYMGDNVYGQLLRAKQLKDNAEYRKMYFDAQQEQNKILNEIKEKELAFKQGKEAFDRYMAGKQLSIEEQKLALGYYKAKNQGKNKAGYQKFQTAMSDNKLALQQIADLKKAIKENPKALGLIVGSFAKGKEPSQKIANEFISSDPKAIGTRAGVSKLRGTTMHDLAGTAQTLQEQRNLAPFLPDLTDSPKTALAKLEQLEKELLREQNKFNVLGQDLGYFDNQEQEADPLGIL